MSNKRDDIIDEDLPTLLDNSQFVINKQSHIIEAFESHISSDKKYNNFDNFAESVFVALSDTEQNPDRDEAIDILNSLSSLAMNLDQDLIDELLEQDVSSEFLDLVSTLSIKYGTDLSQRYNRIHKGRNWWSNIKTNFGIRSNSVYFEHELILDYEREIEFHSNITSTFILINHLIRQIRSVPDVIGEDVLAEVSLAQMEEIEEHLSELKEEVEEYHEKYELDEKSDRDEGEVSQEDTE